MKGKQTLEFGWPLLYRSPDGGHSFLPVEHTSYCSGQQDGIIGLPFPKRSRATRIVLAVVNPQRSSINSIRSIRHGLDRNSFEYGQVLQWYSLDALFVGSIPQQFSTRAQAKAVNYLGS